VTVLPHASADVHSILKETGLHNLAYSLQLELQIRSFFSSLEQQPFVGDIIKSSRHGDLREYFVPPYRVYFTVNELTEEVRVSRVIHYKRRPPRSPE